MFALFLPALVGALAGAMATFVGRAILALGVGFVTYKGIDLAIGVLQEKAISGVRGLPGDVVNFVAYLWLDKAMTIVFSAMVTAMTMRLVSGGLKKMVAK